MEATQHAKESTTVIDLGGLLDAGAGAVVTLEAGETRLAAHRAVLSARSPVFAAMFAHDTLEASSGTVAIPDVEGPVLRQLLSYLYTLQAPQLPGVAPQLLAAADKYAVSALKDACEQQVAAQLCVETAAAAVVLAIRHSCCSLKQAAVAFIKSHVWEVTTTQGWFDAVRMHHEEMDELRRMLSETSTLPPVASGTHPPPTAQLPDGRSQSPTPAMSRHTLPPDDTSVSRLRTLPPVASRTRPAPTAQLPSGRRESPAPTTSHRTPPLDDAVISYLRTLPPMASGTRPPPTAQPPSGRNQSPAPATSRHTLPPDDAAVSRLRRLSPGQKNRRLIEAAKEGAVGQLEALLAAGADVGAANEYRETSLHWAAGRGHEEAARRLLVAGAVVDARDSQQWTPLHCAALRGHAAVVRLLLAAGADHSARDEDGMTPLHWAADWGHTEAAAALLQGGADRRARDRRRRTPLHLARQRSQQQLLDLLQGRQPPHSH